MRPIHLTDGDGRAFYVGASQIVTVREPDPANPRIGKKGDMERTGSYIVTSLGGRFYAKEGPAVVADLWRKATAGHGAGQ